PRGDVEWNSDQVTNVQHLNIAALLDHFARDLMSQNQSLRSRRPPTHHVLIRPADVGSDDLQDHPVRGVFSPERIRLTLGHLELRKGYGLNLHHSRLDVRNSSITRHG